MKCSSPVCDRKAWARGLCSAHYKRMRKGLPLDVTIQPRAKSVAERIETYLDVGVSGLSCWEWTGGHTADGYASTPSGYAHRVVYEFLVEPIPDGMTIDHLCRNRGCVNPDHLEPVTHSVNALRGQTGKWKRAT
jgi:hypothetical protein